MSESCSSEDEVKHKPSPQPRGNNLPQPLSELYDPEMENANYLELLDKCEEAFEAITISEDEIDAVEDLTREQSESDDWFQYRIGRITASVFGEVAKTKKYMPAKSTIKKICEKRKNLSTSAIKWGKDNESVALERLQSEVSCVPKVKVPGLRIHGERPYLGASPDGLTRCECHGDCLVEIKCPYKYRNGLPNDNSDKDFCLTLTDDGKWQLKHNHKYYYQVQLQLEVWNMEYCHFYVWTQEDTAHEVIQRDMEFFDQRIGKVEHIYKYGVLPELIGKFYTSDLQEDEVDGNGVDGQESDEDDDLEVSGQSIPPEDLVEDHNDVCYCRKMKNDDMVTCTNENCEIKHYHRKCLRIRDDVNKGWKCPSCHKLKKRGKK